MSGDHRNGCSCVILRASPGLSSNAPLSRHGIRAFMYTCMHAGNAQLQRYRAPHFARTRISIQRVAPFRRRRHTKDREARLGCHLLCLQLLSRAFTSSETGSADCACHSRAAWMLERGATSKQILFVLSTRSCKTWLGKLARGPESVCTVCSTSSIRNSFVGDVDRVKLLQKDWGHKTKLVTEADQWRIADPAVFCVHPGTAWRCSVLCTLVSRAGHVSTQLRVYGVHPL